MVHNIFILESKMRGYKNNKAFGLTKNLPVNLPVTEQITAVK